MEGVFCVLLKERIHPDFELPPPQNRNSSATSTNLLAVRDELERSRETLFEGAMDIDLSSQLYVGTPGHTSHLIPHL